MRVLLDGVGEEDAVVGEGVVGGWIGGDQAAVFGLGQVETGGDVEFARGCTVELEQD